MDINIWILPTKY